MLVLEIILDRKIESEQMPRIYTDPIQVQTTSEPRGGCQPDSVSEPGLRQWICNGPCEGFLIALFDFPNQEAALQGS